MATIYCSECVLPSSSAVPVNYNKEGLCSACQVSETHYQVDWSKRMDQLREITDGVKRDDGYDIMVPVSGGKDSYFQAHIASKVLGLKTLLTTYHGNNYLPEGEYNLHRMREVFDCDHIIVRPSVQALIKMNRIGFKLHGDPNLHAHIGIQTLPMQLAAKYGIQIALWGEHGGMSLAGMYNVDDFVEYTAKYRKEHAQHGFDWDDFTDPGLEKLGRPDLKEGLTLKDMLWAKVVDDETIMDIGLRGIYLSNFHKWNANEHVKLVTELYQWREGQQEFERTYRKMSNLDDMHENGIHDYLKFIKFGYGRATDHACKDVRAGIMDRKTAIEMVRKYDAVKPMRDLTRWLEYVGMTEVEFDSICDTFRDPRVWSIENDQWYKADVWGGRSSYGPVKNADLLSDKDKLKIYSH